MSSPKNSWMSDETGEERRVETVRADVYEAEDSEAGQVLSWVALTHQYIKNPFTKAGRNAAVNIQTCPSGTICRLYNDLTTAIISTKCLKFGFCPDPLWGEQQGGGKAQCQRLCEEDTECPGLQRCCTDLYGCGRQCRDPLPEYTCDTKKCEEGQSCIMERTKCSGENCLVATCVNATCSPPCGEDLNCEMDVNPTCTTGRCPLICRCLPKQPVCMPMCDDGYSCILTQPPGCASPPCPKVPRCRPQCDPHPGGINESSCGVYDVCTPNPAPGQRLCSKSSVCCRTICGYRCTPLPR
ncbi:keratin-associated protein 4-11-like [Pomacea canaliculata]|uniref:keratin-associated protein 4-11-like n=1 Tax=Pomacea canaliculata TaxID=400727 RepID=UPI000D7345FC|nr:keratin-associated protein 4-11-like [Pomacea canaliculata]